MENTDLRRFHPELEAKYEEKRLVLLVAKTKFMTEQGSFNARMAEMREEQAAMQYQVNMDEEKFNQILRAHKLRTLKLVADTLNKGWKT